MGEAPKTSCSLSPPFFPDMESKPSREPASVAHSEVFTTAQHYTSREKSKRPQLSCNACRARKVKCDRVQPCTACSLHQIAELCHYDLTEAERQPILQAEALREKDKEITQLRLELMAFEGSPGKPDVPLNDSDSRKKRKPASGIKGSKKPSSIRQKKYTRVEESKPHLSSLNTVAEVIKEIADLTIRSKSTNPPCSSSRVNETFKQGEMFFHPFPTFWVARDGIAGLVPLVPDREEALSYIESFHNRVQNCILPQLSDQCSTLVIDQFLSNLEKNSLVQPERLALLFVLLALGLQFRTNEQTKLDETPELVISASSTGEVFIAAAFQALRIAVFMTKPSLVVVETLLMMGHYLTDSGKIEDSWALFGLTIRLAQSIELHRDPNLFDPKLSARECETRKNVWCWMLYIDQRYSMILDRPLGISSVGDCTFHTGAQPETVSQNLWNYRNRITILARQILSPGQLRTAQIVDFTDHLLSLHSSLPNALRFERNWLTEEASVTQWTTSLHAAWIHQEVHTLVVLLYRQRTEQPKPTSSGDKTRPVASQGRQEFLQMNQSPSVVQGSCREILFAFDFLHSQLQAGMASWTVCQQALNAANILTLSMFEVEDTQDYPLICRAYENLLKIPAWGIDRLAGAAVQRLRSLIENLQFTDPRKERAAETHAVTALNTNPLQDFGQAVRSPMRSQVTDSIHMSSAETNSPQSRKSGRTSERSSKKQKVSTAPSRVQRHKTSVKKSQRKESPTQHRPSGLVLRDNWQFDLSENYTGHESHVRQQTVFSNRKCSATDSGNVCLPAAHDPPRQHMPDYSNASRNPFEIHTPSHSPSYDELGKSPEAYGHKFSSDAKLWECFDPASAHFPHEMPAYPPGLVNNMTATSLSQSYPPSLQSVSHPLSSYANSTVSSLPTPLASYPVSPILSQNQGYCMIQPQTQPHSPDWDFKGSSDLAGGAAAMVSAAIGENLGRDDMRWMWGPG